jgi:ABC-type siderophore export system fused ATPase/permease subunit
MKLFAVCAIVVVIALVAGGLLMERLKNRQRSRRRLEDTRFPT